MDDIKEADNWNDEARIACQFSFRCPQTWDRLTLTGNPGIRHCSECNGDVHLAITQEDFRRYGEEGKCVAVKVISASNRNCFIVGNAGRPFNWHLKKV